MCVKENIEKAEISSDVDAVVAGFVAAIARAERRSDITQAQAMQIFDEASAVGDTLMMSLRGFGPKVAEVNFNGDLAVTPMEGESNVAR